MRVPLLLCLLVVFGCRAEPVGQEPGGNPPGEEELDGPELVLTCADVKPTPPPPTPGACREGWCWAHPLPQGLVLSAVWAAGPDSAWMVGPAGTTVRAQGDALALIDTGTQAALNDVWGSSEQDVWATGDGGTLLHWDGVRWQAVPGPTAENLTALSGSSASDVWAAGKSGTLLHWDGVAWSKAALPATANVRDIASAGQGTVWVTTGPELLRCTVLSCETISASVQIGGKSFSLKQLLSFAPDEVFALSTELLRWQNGTWTSLYTNDLMRISSETLMAGSGPEDLWISVYYPGMGLGFPRRHELTHYGTAPHGPPPPATIVGYEGRALRGMAAPAPGRLYLATWGAEVFRLADTGWRPLQTAVAFRVAPELAAPRLLERDELVTDVAALPNGEAGVAGLGRRPRWSRMELFSDSAGDTWVAEASRVPRYFYQGVWVESETLTLAVSRVSAEGTTVEYTSSKEFDGDPSDFTFARPIAGIHGSAPNNVWVVTASEVLRWNGTQWSAKLEVASEERSEFTGAVWSTSPRAAWIGLKNGLLFWNGRTFERVELEGFWVSALWASSSSDVWAVGARGTVPTAYHFDGSTWSEVQLPAEAAGIGGLVDVVGQCKTDMYLVGQRAVLHWDGARWATVPMPLGISMSRAAKVGGELWVVGNLTMLARRPW